MQLMCAHDRSIPYCCLSHGSYSVASAMGSQRIGDETAPARRFAVFLTQTLDVSEAL